MSFGFYNQLNIPPYLSPLNQNYGIPQQNQWLQPQSVFGNQFQSIILGTPQLQQKNVSLTSNTSNTALMEIIKALLNIIKVNADKQQTEAPEVTANTIESQMTALEAAQILNDNLDMFDLAAGIGKKDYLITKKDLETMANNTSSAMAKQRKAAQYILNNKNAYDALDVTVDGQKTDAIIGGTDLKNYLGKQGLKNVTNSSDYAPWLTKTNNTPSATSNTTSNTKPAVTTAPADSTTKVAPKTITTTPTTPTIYTSPTSNKAVGPQDTKSDPIIQAQGRNYFVDSVNGSDSNDGSSADRPLKTLSKINGGNFQPGDVINLARGSRFTGGLTVNSSGTADKPITVRAYGNGDRPEINNTGHYSSSVIVNGDHINLESLKATGAMEDGFRLSKGAEYNVIKNCEATNVGIGIALRGANNKATQNYIHDLHLVVNTQGGDDDYGAVGTWLFASNNEVSYNRMENLIGQSYDYGTDGGACEVTGDVSNSKVIGNVIKNTNAFMEFSQGNGGVAANNIIADNIVEDFGPVFTSIHTGSHFGVNVKNLLMTNNTLINSAANLNNKNYLHDFDGPKLSNADYIFKDDNKLIVK